MNTQFFHTKIVSFLLVVSIFGSTTFAAYGPLFSNRAEAQLDAVVVIGNTDPGTLLFHTLVGGTQLAQTTIMQVLNGLAWTVAKTAIKSMTHSIVNWINSGFEGSPAFETDLNQGLRRLGDGIAASFVNELLNNTSINSPYLQRALGTVAQGYLLYTSKEAIAQRLRYTLGDYSANEDAFRRGDFSQGGFNAWFAITRQCGNDPYCVQFAAQEELVNRIDNATRQRLDELDWGRGFLSWKNCPSASAAGGHTGGASLSDADSSSGCTISTPGSVIEGMLIPNLNSPLHQLELADSINEIVGALASQMVSQVIGATGLLGASAPSADTGRSFLEQTAQDNQAAITLVDGFEAAVQRQIGQERAAQSAWQTFRPLAAGAVQACTVGNFDGTASAQATGALARADAALVQTAGSIAKLTDILSRVSKIRTQTGINQSAAIQQVTADYNAVLSASSDTPSEELSNRMTQITNVDCRRSIR